MGARAGGSLARARLAATVSRVRAILVLTIVILSGCQAGQSALPPFRPEARAAPSGASVPWSGAPVRLPEDDAPHDVLTEWWYYTGHLWTEAGSRYGFQFVIFQTVRGTNPVGYLAHFAITDVGRERHSFAARVAQRRAVPSSLDLEVGGWTLQGGAGRDSLSTATEGYGLELALTPQKPAVLHAGGSISFGAAGHSYYYSRTRLAVAGTMRDGDSVSQVAGLAWHDHQWGDFIVAPVGGWDWFSIQLDDGADLMLTVLRGPAGDRTALFGTYVDGDGGLVDLSAEGIEVRALGAWTSARTGATYPSGWELAVGPIAERAVPRLNLRVVPLIADQELAFDRMPYWEGAVDVSGMVDGRPAAGLGYVELTGYSGG